MNYDFEGSDFGLSGEGVHLLRSGFNYKTIQYPEITKATIRRSTEIKNPLIAVVFGGGLLVFAVLQIVHVVGLFNDPQVHRIHAGGIIVPFLPGVFGIYLLYVAGKKGLVLILEDEKSSQKLRLSDFNKDKSLKKVIAYLNTRLPNRLEVI